MAAAVSGSTPSGVPAIHRVSFMSTGACCSVFRGGRQAGRVGKHPTYRSGADSSLPTTDVCAVISASVAAAIAVFGATGKEGNAVANALLDQGARVRALVRRPDSQSALTVAERRVELVRVDLDDPGTLVPALSGVDAFFFMTTPGRPNGPEGGTRQGVALADAAAKANVPHVVFSSVGGAERSTGIPHFESKRRVEEHLESLKLRTTFIRPVFYIDNLASVGIRVENGEIIVRLPMPDGIPLQMVAVRDIGVITAAALFGTAQIRGGSIEIAGDECTGSEIAALAEHAGLPARYEALPVEVLDGQYDAHAMFRRFADLPANQADFEATRAIDPDVYNMPAWLSATGWKPAVCSSANTSLRPNRTGAGTAGRCGGGPVQLTYVLSIPSFRPCSGSKKFSAKNGSVTHMSSMARAISCRVCSLFSKASRNSSFQAHSQQVEDGELWKRPWSLCRRYS